MRLINCRNLRLEEFLTSKVPKYAILSHTWGSEEVSFAEINSFIDISSSGTASERAQLQRIKNKAGYKKIRSTCEQALRDGFYYAWVDTCCIDKTSSAELSESINSMFRYYRESDLCYACLTDVHLERFEETFDKSRWFRGGWTLQELLAPTKVIFYDVHWKPLGDKLHHVKLIARITTIDEKALLGLDQTEDGGLSTYCVTRRMSWAANRETTRVEDMAYSLLGIFNVNMPLLYGEGPKAFIRLQEEIIKNCKDESIFAWGLQSILEEPFDSSTLSHNSSMYHACAASKASAILASNPNDFRDCGRLRHTNSEVFPFNLTPFGLQIEVCLVSVKINSAAAIGPSHCWIGILNCKTEKNSELVGIVLSPVQDLTSFRFYRRAIGDLVISNQSNVITIPAKNTILVGETVASKAVRCKITILMNHTPEESNQYSSAVRKYLINASPKLLQNGYFVGAGKLIDSSGIQIGRAVQWNGKSHILTSPNLFADNFYSFHLICTRPRPLPSFTLFIYESQAVVRQGVNLDSRDITKIFDFLQVQSQSQVSDIPNSELITSEGKAFHITVSIKERAVYHWNIFDVDVDVVFVTKRIETQEPT